MDLHTVGWGVDWIDLAQDRDRLWTLVNSVLNFGFHKMRGISGLAQNGWGSPAGLSCMMQVSNVYYSNTIIFTIPMWTLIPKWGFQNILTPQYCITILSKFSYCIEKNVQKPTVYPHQNCRLSQLPLGACTFKIILHHSLPTAIYENLSLTKSYSFNFKYDQKFGTHPFPTGWHTKHCLPRFLHTCT